MPPVCIFCVCVLSHTCQYSALIPNSVRVWGMIQVAGYITWVGSLQNGLCTVTVNPPLCVFQMTASCSTDVECFPCVCETLV